MKKEIFEAQHLVEAKEEAFKKMNMKEEDLIIRICDKSEKENPDMCVIEVYQKDELTQKIKDFLIDNIKRFKENFIISTKIWIIMMIIGVVLAALATVLYLKPALGSGPRDGLMLAINKRSSKSVGTVRTIIELSVLFIGWILGGSVGIGTIISGVGLGYAIEIGFKISHMDSKTLVHKNIYDSIKLLRNKDAQIATCVETDKEK